MKVKFGLYEDVIKSGTGLYDYTQFREATVKKWQVRAGDSVKKGDVIVLVDSEKAELEIIALSEGVIVSLNYEEGEKWYQGDTEDTPLGRLVLPELGVMEIAGESESEISNTSRMPQLHDMPGNETSFYLSPLAAKLAGAKNIPREDLARAYPNKRRIEKEDVENFLKRRLIHAIPSPEEIKKHSARADPAARRRARELGIEPSRVSASREDGKIRVEDVEQYAASLASASVEKGIEKDVAHHTNGSAAVTIVPASEMRKTIARFMQKSWQEIPHAGDEVTIDITRLARYRDTIKEFWKKLYGTDLRYDHFIMYFAAKHALLDEFKIINAYWNDETQCIHYLPHVNLGVAVQRPLDQGLLVPVVHNADTMSFCELVKSVNEKVLRAIQGKLTLYDMRDLSFTVNRVAFHDEKTGHIIGGEHPHSLIPWTRDTNGDSEGRPTSMILSLSKIIAEGDRMLLRAVFRFDHRIFDGETPLRFAHALKDFIENSDFSDVVTK